MSRNLSLGAAPTDPTPAGTADTAEDTRVSAVLAVLRGATLESAASTWSVDAALLRRWVGAFVDAGTARVANRPDEAGTRQRDRFLAAFAYEMRAPLAVALGVAEGLHDEAPTRAVEKTSERLVRALVDLADRVTDVELLVSAAMGGLHPQRSRVTVGTLCQDQDLDLGEVLGKGGDYEVAVDRLLFARVLGDLWRAAALSPVPRSRRLLVRVVGPWVELRVLREGDPIPVEVLQALFEPFETDGLTTGITTGLYLARALTVAHGGTLGVDQHESGAGLWVRVPLAADPERTGTDVVPAPPPAAPDNGGQP